MLFVRGLNRTVRAPPVRLVRKLGHDTVIVPFEVRQRPFSPGTFGQPQPLKLINCENVIVDPSLGFASECYYPTGQGPGGIGNGGNP